MWNTKLTRRELIELVIGARKLHELKLQRGSGVLFEEDPSLYYAFWNQEPTVSLPLPTLVVVPDNGIADLLIAFNSTPQAPTPVTAFFRLLTRQEASVLFDKSLLNITHDVNAAIAVLAMAEAVVHTDGRLSLRQLTPAICKRTLSYAWGIALCAQVPASALEGLPSRWLDTYSIVNASTPIPAVKSTVGSLISPLGMCAQLAMGIKPDSVVGKLAFATLNKERALQEQSWQELASMWGSPLSLQAIAGATREERGSYLQGALKQLATKSLPDGAAAAAFLATQIAPGSLEHFELLKVAGSPNVALWYAMFAALQAPGEVLAGTNGVGHRLVRDLTVADDPISRPTADLAYHELKVLERAGLDVIGRKLGHLGEIEVELIPRVTSSFSFHTRIRPKNDTESQLSFDMDVDAPERVISNKARFRQLLGLMSDLVRDMPDMDVAPRGGTKRVPNSSSRRSRYDSDET